MIGCISLNEDINDAQDEDPHGVRKLLALLRTQQDKNESNGPPSSVQQQGQSSNLSINNPPTPAVISQEPPKNEDVRYISFAQALPHLTRLSKDEGFLAALLRLKVSREAMMLADRLAEFCLPDRVSKIDTRRRSQRRGQNLAG